MEFIVLAISFLVIAASIVLLAVYWEKTKNDEKVSDSPVGSARNDFEKDPEIPMPRSVPYEVYAMADRLLKHNVGEYLLRDYNSNTNFTIVKDISKELLLRRDLTHLMMSILSYLGLPGIVDLKINYLRDIDTQKEAGQYTRNIEKRAIELNVRSDYDFDNIIAILCHECTHYFMEWNNLNIEDREQNERNTDITANLIGFSEFMIKGYRTSQKTEDHYSYQTVRTSKTIGYE